MDMASLNCQIQGSCIICLDRCSGEVQIVTTTGGNLPEEFLSNIYSSIRRNEIKLSSEAASNSLEVDAQLSYTIACSLS